MLSDQRRNLRANGTFCVYLRPDQRFEIVGSPIDRFNWTAHDSFPAQDLIQIFDRVFGIAVLLEAPRHGVLVGNVPEAVHDSCRHGGPAPIVQLLVSYRATPNLARYTVAGRRDIKRGTEPNHVPS
jgi:hypothetical protein